MSFDHNEINLDIGNRKILGKFSSIWKLNSAFLHNQAIGQRRSHRDIER